jgi:hypothetical protein
MAKELNGNKVTVRLILNEDLNMKKVDGKILPNKFQW